MNCLKRLDDENFRINFPKCHLVMLEIDWLGYHLSQSGIAPLESKTAAILALEAPKTVHRTLLSIMKENRSNKSYNTRLTRWIDRLTPISI